MLERPGRAFGTASRAAAFAVLAVLILSGLPRTASAEIPHENYDIANPDLDTVINMLNASIRASEGALMEFYNESVTTGNQYLDMVHRVLGPADQLLSSIQNVAESYQNLSGLLPPFDDLYDQMSSFASMEVTFLQDRDELNAASHLLNMTDAQRKAALDVIASVEGLMDRMNGTIDQMLVSANDITTMTVASRQPFTPNQLEPLILKLRDLLHAIMLEIEEIIHNGVPWGPDQAFLLLWIGDSQLYLGEDLVGGGYLFYNSSFRVGKPIELLMDSRGLMNVTTTTGGAFHFSYTIPMNATMVARHTIFARASTPFVNLTSDVLSFTVSLVPTSLTIEVDKKLMSIDESVTATATLKDVRGKAIYGARVYWSMDSSARIPSDTGNGGVIRHKWDASGLGFGMHFVNASYVGRLPYAPCTSPTLQITVNIPTTIQLQLFSNTFAPGYYIVGNGTLSANESQRMSGQHIAILLDGTIVLNVTTDTNGGFAFSLSSKDVAGGTHTLRAEFLERDVKWRYSEAEVTFTIGRYHLGKYPFLPFFPGWQTGPNLEIPYLFFGPYAYYTWLFMLLILGVIVKTLQIRRRRVEEATENPLAVAPLLGISGTPEASAEAPFSIESFAASMPEGPKDPNAQIVWYYHGFLDFLRRKRRVGIADSMTHWEVARLLRTLGYQREGVERVTVLFEKAFYSGTAMSDVDAVSMSSAMSGLMITKGGATSAS